MLHVAIGSSHSVGQASSSASSASGKGSWRFWGCLQQVNESSDSDKKADEKFTPP